MRLGIESCYVMVHVTGTCALDIAAARQCNSDQMFPPS